MFDRRNANSITRVVTGFWLLIVCLSFCVVSSPVFAQSRKAPQRFTGITFDGDGNIVLVEKMSCTVQVFTKAGKGILKFGGKGPGEGKLLNPQGIAIDDEGRFIVADTGHHRISIFSAKGEHVVSLGELGSEDGQFTNPSDVAVDSEGYIYVTDTRNNRLQIFSREGDFIATFGDEGIGHGQFREPMGITVDSNDRVLVVDRNNWRLEIFAKGDEPGKLYYLTSILALEGPNYVTTDAQDNIIITEAPRVRIFDSAGKPKGLAGSKQVKGLSRPFQAIMDEAGKIYITDLSTDKVLQSKESELQYFEIGRGVKGIAIDSKGRIIVTEQGSHVVRILDKDGNQIQELGYRGREPGRFFRPKGVSVDSHDNIYVADTFNHRIQVLSKNGDFVNQIGWKGEDDGYLLSPHDVWIDKDDYVYVADTSNHRIQVFNSDGDFVAKFGEKGKEEGEFKMPRGITVDSKDRIIVADSDNSRVQVLSFDKETGEIKFLRASGPDFWSPKDVCVDDEDRIYLVEPGNRVAKVIDNETLKAIKGFRGRCVGGLSEPLGIAVKGNAVFIADTRNNRIVKTNTEFLDPEIEVSSVSENSAVVEWTSLGNDISLVRYGSSKDLRQTKIVEKKSKEHRIELSGLSPSTRYRFRVKGPLPIYLSDEFSVMRRFATLAKKGTTQYLTLPMVGLIYRETTFHDKYPEEEYPDVKSPKRLTDEDIEKIKERFAEVRLFVWRHTSMKLNVDFRFVVIEEPVGLLDIGGDEKRGYILGSNRRVIRDLVKALRPEGRSITDYAGVLTIYPFKSHRSDKLTIRSWAMAATAGVPASWPDRQYVWTTGHSGLPFDAEWGAKTFFLLRYKILHEFMQQLQALLRNSGYLSFPSTDRPGERLPHCGRGRYGKLAQVFQFARPHDWLALSHGRLGVSLDADGDGIPDSDNSVALDEKRLGTDPTTADSDKDGLNDLEELVQGAHEGSDPLKADTDGDGLKDGEDSCPLADLGTEVTRGTPVLDGKLSEEEGWAPFLTIVLPESGKEAARLYACWDDDAFHLAFEQLVPELDTVNMYLDLSGDGWYRGKDNIELQYRNRYLRQTYWDATTGRWPRTHNISKDWPIKQERTSAGDLYTFEVRIPAYEPVGFMPKKGSVFGFDFHIRGADWQPRIEGLFKGAFAQCTFAGGPHKDSNEEGISEKNR